MEVNHGPHNSQDQDKKGARQHAHGEELSTSLPTERTRHFIQTHAVELTQELARKLLQSNPSEETRNKLVSETYNNVTEVLQQLHPSRADDIAFLAQVVEALFELDDDNGYAEDIYCSDIGSVKFKHQDIKDDIEFIHNLLSSIQRIGQAFPGESTNRNFDVNEEFLLVEPERLLSRLTDEKREFFHH